MYRDSENEKIYDFIDLIVGKAISEFVSYNKAYDFTKDIDNINTELSNIKKEIATFNPGQWIEVRLQALEQKELDIRKKFFNIEEDIDFFKAFIKNNEAYVRLIEEKLKDLTDKEVNMRIKIGDFIESQIKFQTEVINMIENIQKGVK